MVVQAAAVLLVLVLPVQEILHQRVLLKAAMVVQEIQEGILVRLVLAEVPQALVTLAEQLNLEDLVLKVMVGQELIQL
jgi:hypothetical protein